MFLLKSMPNIFFTKKVVALSGGHDHSECAVKESFAGVQRTGRGLALRGDVLQHGERRSPAGQEPGTRGFYRQESGQGTLADALCKPGSSRGHRISSIRDKSVSV